MNPLVLGVAWYVVFLFSTVLHEAAHALAALMLGDPTAYYGGHVTLDPTPHIRREPLGTVVVPVVSFLLRGWMIGWASVPYDPLWAIHHPRRAAVMSAAGPAANLLLVLLAALLIHLGIFAGAFEVPDKINFTHAVEATAEGAPAALALLVSLLFSLNLILFTFNLLPLPPLDGSSILCFFLSRDAADRWREIIWNPTFSSLGLVAAWLVFSPLFRPIHLLAINLLYPGHHFR